MKTFIYIFKRIIIGVGIALILSYLRGNFFVMAHALDVSPFDLTLDSSNPVLSHLVSNITSGFDITLSDHPWSIHNGSSGYIHLSFSVNKITGTSTSSVVLPRGVSVEINNTSYICDIGSTNIQNSTYNGAIYSAVCPVRMGSTGLTAIHVRFNDLQPSDTSQYSVRVNSSVSYEISDSTNVQVNVDTSGTTSAINNQTSAITQNQNQNTQSIINNNDTNTGLIMQNQNQNTQSINDNISNQFNKTTCNGGVCNNIFTYTNTGSNNRITYSWSNGKLTASGTTRSTTSVVQLLQGFTLSNTAGSYQVLISNPLSYDLQFTSTCTITAGTNSNICTFTDNQPLQINLVTGASAVVDISDLIVCISDDLEQVVACEYGSDTTICVTTNRLDDVNSSVQDINNNINDTNINGASGEASSFFDNFNVSSHGLSGIVTAPIRLLNSFTTASCTPLTFQLPFLHNQITLPCMKSIYQTYFGVFFTLWQMLTTGVICWNTSLNFYKKIRDLQNPKNDRIEVLSL